MASATNSFSYFTVERMLDVSVLTLTNMNTTDPLTVLGFRQELYQFIDDERPKKVIIDFRAFEPKIFATDFVGIFFNLKARLEPFGGRHCICDYPEILGESLRHLDPKQQVLRRFPTLAEAWNLLGAA